MRYKGNWKNKIVMKLIKTKKMNKDKTKIIKMTRQKTQYE